VHKIFSYFWQQTFRMVESFSFACKVGLIYRWPPNFKLFWWYVTTEYSDEHNRTQKQNWSSQKVIFMYRKTYWWNLLVCIIFHTLKTLAIFIEISWKKFVLAATLKKIYVWEIIWSHFWRVVKPKTKRN
jgi:hypothetical protein